MLLIWVMELELRYQEIQNQLEELSDFQEQDLLRSRQLFELERFPVVPKKFEVWTSLVGLPLSQQLTQIFKNITHQIANKLPAHTRFYQVNPQNYHWELLIIKRPDEQVDSKCLQEVPQILKDVLSNHPSFALFYRGFLITTDGTLIVKGYGDFEELRTKLLEAIPFASLKQSQLGHISLGRILDPIGQESFREIKNLVRNSYHELYGELEVNTVKYVHESQWYMEEREVIATLPVGN